MERSLSKTLVTITIIILSIGIITILVWLAIKIYKSNDRKFMEDTTTNIIVSKGNDNIKDSDNTIQTGPDTFNDVILPEYKDLIKQIEEASNTNEVKNNQPKYEDIVDTRPNEYVDESDSKEEQIEKALLNQIDIPKLTIENGEISRKTKDYLLNLTNYVTVNIINSGLVDVELYCMGKPDRLGNKIDIDNVLKNLSIGMEYKLGFDLYFASSTDKIFDDIIKAWKDLSLEIDKVYKDIVNNKDKLGSGYQIDIQKVLEKNAVFRNFVVDITEDN